MADILKRTRQQLTAGGNGTINGAVTLDARVERLEMAMQAVTDRLDDEAEQRRSSTGADSQPAKSYPNYHGMIQNGLRVQQH